jgi:carbonic anhydrase
MPARVRYLSGTVTNYRAPLAVLILAACSSQKSASSAADASSLPTEPAASAASGEPPAADVPSAVAPAAPPPASAASHEEHNGVAYLLAEASERTSQSPINIVSSRTVAGKHEVKFNYKASNEHVDNLGHTVKVTYDAGSSLEYDGTRYDLVQFHFHTPSEHLLDGVTYPMEMHLVHAEHDHPEHLLVVGVLFKEGQGHPLLDRLVADVPAHAGEHADKDAQLDASSILARGDGYYHYDGSLTTPPYSETVTWLVLDQPHQAAAEQIEALNRIEGNNARHIQEQRARLVDHWR